VILTFPNSTHLNISQILKKKKKKKTFSLPLPASDQTEFPDPARIPDPHHTAPEQQSLPFLGF
jgi:hypothetical protein